jgi:hypothetical protein
VITAANHQQAAEQQRVSPAAQWRLTQQGLANLQHGHKVGGGGQRAVTADAPQKRTP